MAHHEAPPPTVPDPAPSSPPPAGAALGRPVAWIALAIAVAMIGWPMLRPNLPPPGDLPEARTDLGYPAWQGRVSHAHDLRGRPGPALIADQWIGTPPTLEDRVVIIDFWATWCGPCIASLPHLDELAERFGDRAAFVGLSGETESQFREGLSAIGRAPEDFGAALALDPVRRTASAAGVQAIPHMLVMSRDGIVRWQGMPRDLDAATLGAIIEADATSAASATSATSATSPPDA